MNCAYRWVASLVLGFGSWAAQAAPAVPSALIAALPADADVLGVYQVTDIVKKGSRIYNGSICSPYVDKLGYENEAERNCGATFVAIRTPKSVALFELKGTPQDEKILYNFVMSEAVFSPQCKGSVRFAEGQALNLDSGNLCRMSRVKAWDVVKGTGKKRKVSQSFVYFDDVAAGSREFKNNVHRFQVSGLLVPGFSIKILLPAGIPPKAFEITTRIKGGVLLSSSWDEVMKIRRVDPAGLNEQVAMR